MTERDLPTYAVRLSVLGQVRDVLAPSELVAGQLRRAWSRSLSDAVPTCEPLRLARSALMLSAAMAQRLVSELTVSGITAADPRLLLLHAAGVTPPVGSPEGPREVLGLVGASGAGKTTAAVALGRAGWGYVTDECLAVWPDGSVLGYPKPVCLVPEVGEPRHDAKTVVGPDELGLAEASGRLRLGRLVALHRDPAHRGPAAARPLATLDAVELLVAQSSGLARAPRPLQRLVRHLHRTSGMAALDYADVGQLLAQPRVLIDLLATTSGGPDDGPGGDPERAGPIPVEGVERVAPLVLDAVADGDGALVLRADATIRLGPATAQVWQAVLAGDDGELAAYRREVGADVVAAHLAALAEAHLLPADGSTPP